MATTKTSKPMTFLQFKAEVKKLEKDLAASKAGASTGLCPTWDKVKPFFNLFIKAGILGPVATKELTVLRAALNAQCKV